MGIPSTALRWELAAENIVVRIRWIGLFLGTLTVNAAPGDPPRLLLNAILALGAVFTLLDTLWSYQGRVFLGKFPLSVSVMEALFIGVLCRCLGGQDSPFRYYYLLSLICCAIRHPVWVTTATCLLHGLSYTALFLSLPASQREPFGFALTLFVLAWLAWGASALALLLKRVGEHLGELNDALRENQSLLEERIAERTRELQESQAQVVHQEKMAAFGLLAAGIAHEVGNPLASISGIVQLLVRRGPDPVTRDKLDLVGGQIGRIQTIVRELVTFSRPASTERTRFAVAEAVEEALGIAKYYPGTKSRRIERDLPSELTVLAVRGACVQAFLNLILNAVDATAKNGRLRVAARRAGERVRIEVADDGPGVPNDRRGLLFQPYTTTKQHGTGLGLFVVRKLVGAQGGTVEYVETSDGGATFAIELPIAPGRAEEGECTPTPRFSSSMTNR